MDKGACLRRVKAGEECLGLIEITAYPVVNVIDKLLQDKTTGKNIFFATDAYTELGEEYGERSEITEYKLRALNLEPRVKKGADEQLARTRKKAEVFTPSWIVNKMNNYCDEEWFGKPNVFNMENGTEWVTNTAHIVFEGKKTWKNYVDSKRLEITCGEAPYVVSRYDAATGELIPTENRIGILDRKLRVVNENAESDEEWLKWSVRALQASYGYEFQGDNLTIARINVLNTMTECYELRFKERADKKLLETFANIISWNFWQMDGITGTIPYTVPENYGEMTFFDEETENLVTNRNHETAPFCMVKDWRANKAVSYDEIRGGKRK
jgi:hypothetical protein